MKNRASMELSVKYFYDKVLSIVLLFFLSPVLLFIAFTIWFEDRGKFFFTQSRLGLNGKIFRIWKFRTMVEDADNLLNIDGTVSVNRITRVGNLLRRSSLDELPQLINILKGEMSFIGPRPVLPSHLIRYTDEQKKRLGMKPGITGLAQVNGRNTLLWSKRIEFDIEYIKNYSLWLDVIIFIKTIKVLMSREGIVADRNTSQVDDLTSGQFTQYQEGNNNEKKN